MNCYKAGQAAATLVKIKNVIDCLPNDYLAIKKFPDQEGLLMIFFRIFTIIMQC